MNGAEKTLTIFFALLVFATDIGARVDNAYQQANAGLIANAAARVDADIQQARDAVAAQSARVNGLAAQVTALRQNQIDPSANDPQLQPAQQEVTELLARQAKAEDDVRRAETHASNGSVWTARRRLHRINKTLAAARARLDALRQQNAAMNNSRQQSSREQLPVFENTQSAEDQKLSSLQEHLATLTQGRTDAIRHSIEQAPEYVARSNGFLAQIVALEEIAQADRKIAAVILLIDVTSFGFELAAVLAKITSFVPTTYAALLARDAYLQVVHLVDAMMAELHAEPKMEVKPPTPFTPPAPANDNHPTNGRATGPNPFTGFDDPPPPSPQPPKRPRGRPRKSTLNGGN